MDGDDLAQFNEFVALRLTALYRYAYVLTGNPHDAEDLVQEALTRAGVAWRRVRRKDDLEGYVRITMARIMANRGVVVWSRNSGRATDEYVRQVFCMEVGEDQVDQIGAHGVDHGPINVDRDIIVWTDTNNPTARDPGDPPTGTVWVASGCQNPRRLPVRGSVLAFNYPDVFLGARVKFTGPVRQVDVRSGRTVTTYTMPRGMDQRPIWWLAANGDVLAWADENSLFITDRGTARSRRVATGLPHAIGASGREGTRLTAGNRLVAYWTSPDSGDGDDPYIAQSLVYDPRTDRTFRLPGDVLAAGDWLLWSEGHDYRLARVR